MSRAPGQRISWVVTGLVLACLAAGGLLLHRQLQTGRKVSAQGEGRASAARKHFDRQRNVDAELVRWRQVDEIPCDHEGLRGIAVGSDGTLYVAANAGVLVIEPGGEPSVMATPGGPARCVAVHEDSGGRRVLVGIGGRVAVMQVDRPLQSWAATSGTGLVTSISPGRETVWAADAANRTVVAFGWDGQQKARLGQPDADTGDTGLIVPSPFLDVAQTPDGGVVIGNPGRHKIETYEASGKRVNSWGKGSSATEGFCGCCNPVHICLLPDGRIVTAEKGIPRVKAYKQDGALDSVIAPPEALSRYAEGLDLAADGQGRVYVLDPPAQVVRVFEEINGPDSGP